VKTKVSVGLVVLCGAAAASQAAEVRGRLLVGDRPATGVTVSAVPYETPFEQAQREARRAPAPKPLASAASRSDGTFVLSVTAAGARGFRLKLEGPGVVPVLTAGVYDASENEDIGDEVLAPASKLAGRVVDEKGKPVAGAEVTLVSRGFGGGPFGGGPFQAQADVLSVPRVALTSADGSFRFDDARAQGNRLTVEARGYATTEVPNARAGALPRPIALSSGLSLSGVVRGAGRAPAKGVLVRFEGKADSRWIETAADGSFRLADLPAGAGTLVADGGDQGMAELRGLSLPEAAAQRLQVTLAPAAAIEGRVVDAKTGKPIARVKVLTRSGGRVGVARSGADGTYRLAGLLPNRYRVEADDPRYVAYERGNIVVLAGATEKVDLPLVPGAAISGRVVDEDGKPIANARGRLTSGGEGGLRAFMRQQRGGERGAFRTGVDGTFKAARLTPGDGQSLTVSHAEFESRTIGGLSLPAGGTRSGVSVVLSRGLSLLGIVKDGDGNPVADAEVMLNQARNFRGGRGGAMVQMNFIGGPEGRPRATTGPDGRFEFKGLTKGDYMLSARKQGFSEAILDPAKVVENGETVELTVSAGASISGLVVDSSGQPAEGYFVQVRSKAGGDSPMRGMGGGRGATGPDGFFSIDGLHPGEAYDLLVMGSDGPGPRREGVTAPAEGIELVVAGKGRIAGRVVDAANGQPVADFEVSFNPDRSARGGMVVRFAAGPGGPRRGAGQREQLHSEDGSFVLDEVSPGTWEVNVDAKGYQAGRVGGVVVEAGQTKDGVLVKLSRGSGIRGRVLDAMSSRPIPDVRVTAETAGGQVRMPMLDLLNGGGGVPTDADGQFEIDGLSQGRYVVSAEHPDFSDASQLVEVKEGLAAAELRLQAGGALGGVVMSETRRALPGAQVVLEPAGEGGLGGRRMIMDEGKAAVSDAQGRFRFDHLTSGRYRVIASLRGRASQPTDVVLQASESRDDLQLQLQAGATIHGFVTGLQQASRANVGVNATGPESYFAATRTGADGAFELEGVPVGTITLRANSGDFLGGGMRSATALVNVPEGQTEVSAEIAFEEGFTLSGAVTRAGQPVPDAFVSANARGGAAGPSAQARSDQGGAYRLEGLKKGSYNVSVFGTGGSKVQQIDIEGDASLDIQIPVARLAGTVVEAGSRQPLADAIVEADAGEAGVGGPRLMRGSATDSNGRFAIEDLEPKAYTLTARRAGFQYERKQFSAAEQGTDELLIELQRGEGIGLQARDGIFGVPLRGLTVRVADAAGASVFMGPVTLDSEGRGEIPSIKPGQYSVMADASGYAPLSFAVTVPAPPVAIAMTPGGNLDLRVNPALLANGALTLQFVDGSGRPYSYSIFAPGGRLVLATPARLIENWSPGRYMLSYAGGKPRSFTIAEGQTTLIELP
jgi:protocatechuate 3,4-dioxygenase beta subunit